MYPGAGATVTPLEYCSKKKATYIGKPGPALLDILEATQVEIRSCFLDSDRNAWMRHRDGPCLCTNSEGLTGEKYFLVTLPQVEVS